MLIHFIGIGGIGVSGLARIYQKQGHQVQGSDQEPSELTEELQQQGIKVFIGHKAENVSQRVGLVVYSEAVPKNNPELQKARQLKIKCWSGAKALGQLSRGHFTIAVSGMHGKSTTASMIANIMIEAGLDPTFVIGTKPGWRLGQSRYLVIEADDFKAKFLHYRPDILVLTNIEPEHLDYFKNIGRILAAFSKYVNQVKEAVVANQTDGNIKKVLKTLAKSSVDVVYYSLQNKEAVDLKKRLQVPGQHNVLNALAALKTARLLNISDQVALKALSNYQGIWRRFELSEQTLGSSKKITLIQDYAHHPTEIKATLEALGEKFPHRKNWIVFQPHQYQRTFYLFDDFVKSLKQSAINSKHWQFFITDIYDVPGRENKAIKAKVSSLTLAQTINQKNVSYMPYQDIVPFLKDHLKSRDVLLVMGAGSVYKLPKVLFTIAG